MDPADAKDASSVFVVAVAGGSGSGKTTLVRHLVAALTDIQPLVLELDHYYRDLSGLSPAERHAVNFDHPEALELDLLHAHIEAWMRGETVVRPCYDFASHTRLAEGVPLESRPVVFVDGLFALVDPRINRLARLRVFVDADDDVRLARRIRRDLAERGRSLDATVSQYFATVKPMHLKFIEPTRHDADIVVPWDRHNQRAAAFIVKSIRQALSVNA